MKNLLPENVKKLRDGMLSNPGHTSPQLRKAIEANAANRSGRPSEPVEIPSELASYVDKVLLHAYKFVDSDVDELLAAGYTEDQIFEVTLSAAMGASIGRMERGLLALKGEV